MVKSMIIFLTLSVFITVAVADTGGNTKNPIVILETTRGEIKIELYPDKAPATVENFLAYVRDGFYDGLIFHRVIKDFVIQAGGFLPEMKPRRPTRPPIKNEAGPDLSNERGTVAMARTMEVDSGTSQFFINVGNNKNLDHVDRTPRGYGYAVFGKVIDGMDVVDEIRSVSTRQMGMFKDVPAEPVIIVKARVLDE